MRYAGESAKAERKDPPPLIMPRRNIGRWRMWFMKAWMDTVKFNLEVQSVVSMRLMKIAAGGTKVEAESTRMVQEKVEAAIAAQTAGAVALAKGRGVAAATKA